MKTEVMAAENSALPSQEYIYIYIYIYFKYIKTENSYFILKY